MMPRSFPPDVVVLDTDGLLHARIARGRKNLRAVNAKTYRFPAGTFTPGMVSPSLTGEAALAEALRRLRMESGRWDKVSLLLPDAWFRINLVELPNLPDRPTEAAEVVRWSLRRTLPIPPEELRVNYTVLSHSVSGVKILVLSALEATLAAIEKSFTAAGMDVVMIEPVGLNIWNAIAVREEETSADRLFLYIRDEDFTTAVFRGTQPLFIRSRNLSQERSVDQEIRLSASYLRDSLNVEKFARCYVAGHQVDPAILQILAAEFDSPVSAVSARDFLEETPADTAELDAELTACTGVFTG